MLQATKECNHDQIGGGLGFLLSFVLFITSLAKEVVFGSVGLFVGLSMNITEKVIHRLQ